MAIKLITGLPGHGKTLYTISRYRDVSVKENRPVYMSGIKGLKLPWIEHDPEKWEDLPPTSIFIIDEAQFKFPLRGRGSPPPWIERLAVHRHAGIDFVLITQNPMLLDSFVRRLIDQHFHVVRKFGTKFATIHEFPNGVAEQVSKSRAGSITHEWRYPSDVFELYTSAEVHTVQARVPMRVWLLMALPFILGAMIWGIYTRLQPDAVAKRAQGELGQAPAFGTIRPGQPGPVAGGPVAQSPGDVAGEYLELHRPRIAGLAYTAPAYDAVTVPTEAPYPAACIQSRTICRCYSQQATVLDVPLSLCAAIVARGFFVAWRDPGRRDGALAGAPAGGVVGSSTVALAGGIRGGGSLPAPIAGVPGGPDSGADPRRPVPARAPGAGS